MSIRDRRQKEFAKKFLDSNRYGIILAAPRFGKIRVAIHVLRDGYDRNAKVLIAYPDTKIKKSWQDDFEILGYNNPNVSYSTHRSLDKNLSKKFDLIIVDEIHLLSEKQIDDLDYMILNNPHVLGLTGTMTKDTKWNLYQQLSMRVLVEYPISQAIEEGIIADYHITVIETPLDDYVKMGFGKKVRTEKKQFGVLSWMIDLFQKEGKNTMYPRLSRMRLIQNSHAKKELTKKVLKKYESERVLVFCGVIKIAEELGIPTYHSKKKDAKKLFDDFASGKGNHLAVVKIGNSGVTYKPLNRVIINYFDSNGENLAQRIQRCAAIEYNNPDKKAEIIIISSNEDVEKKWLDKALEFFDKSKISYVNSNKFN